jgi:hypothetical protein
MSNRFIAILTLFFIWIAWFFYWTFVIVPNKQQVENEEILIEENKPIDLVQVENKELTLEEDVELENLEQDVVEETKWTTENKENPIWQNNWNTNKIQELKESLSSYKNIIVWNKKFSFKILDNNLWLYLNSKLVSTFPLVPENLLEIKKVYYVLWWEYYISVWNEKYIYVENTDTLTEFELNIPINYIKKINGEYLINTTKWTFLLNTKNVLEYVDVFEDFVYYNESYVWILRSSDTRRLNNLWFTLTKNNAVVYYNPITKETKVLYETSLNLNKIYLNGSEIYFEEWENGVYKLENF